MLKIEESDRAMLKLRTDNALRRQTKPIAIKPQRAFEIVDTKSNEGDSWFHRWIGAPILELSDRLRLERKRVNRMRTSSTAE